MDVFLVPVGADRYELYCEEPDEVLARRRGSVWDSSGVWCTGSGSCSPKPSASGAAVRRPMRRRAGFMSRLKARTLRWVSESIAEQRLLWQLRGRVEAGLIYPDDLRPSRRSRSSVVPCAATSNAIDSGW